MIDLSRIPSVSALLQAVARAAPQAPAVIDHGRCWNYAELDARVDALAAHLLRRGALPGERCALLMDNVAEHVAAHFAALRAGLVAVPINARHQAREVLEQVEFADATCLLVSPAHAGAAAAIAAAAPLLRSVLVVSEAGVPAPCASVDGGVAGAAGAVGAACAMAGFGAAAGSSPAARAALEVVDLACLPAPAVPLPERRRDDPYIMWYTSGTTGKPKGVVHDNHSGLCAMQAWVEVWQLGPGDRTLVKNLYHVGMTASVMAFVAAGGSLAMMAGDFSIARLLHDLASQRVTFFSAAPAMLSLFLKHADLVRRHDLSALRLITCGSAPTDPTLFARVVELLPPHIRWTHSWGQTEVNTGGLCLAPDDFFARMGSIGKPISCVTAVSLRDEHGAAVASGAVGELCTRGPTVARGYHKEKWQPSIDGWHHTGDLARVDAAGFYWLVGRQRDLIIRGGENIYPAEVERVLGEYPAVHECVVVGLPDSVMGEVPVAFVEVRPGVPFVAADLLAWCRARLAGYKCPVHVEAVAEFPRNLLGKILRAPLRERALELAQDIGR